jgi:amino acid adenylation domain-containing protein
VDDQVKIRGFRIEPGEIESAIAESKLVSQSVVIAKADQTGSNRLIAYVVVGKTYQKQELLTYLRSKLPDYMIPSVIMELESIPLTANGKVDKRALPQVDQSSDKQYIAPRNKTEKALAEIWQQLLEIEQIGIDANFFELGGHSLLAMRVISQVGKTLDIELKVKDLFQNPSIRQLAFYVSKQSQGLLLPAIDKQIRPEQIPLSFSQERLWFIDQLEGSVQYHIPAVLHLKGKLNQRALNQSFQQIVNRHEVLRTVIRQAQGQPYQQINPVAETIVQTIDAKALTPQERQTLIKSLINKPFDLSQDLMLRADLLELGEEDHLLVVTMHHIASDGWSGPLIVKELTSFYQAYNQDQIPQSEPLAIQYADYAIWQRQNIQGQLLEKKLEYWKQKLQQAEPIELPLDYPRPAVQSIQGAVKAFTLDTNLGKAIKQLSQNSNTSMFMTLLTAFKVLLHRYSNQHDITVGTPIAGRQQMETEPLIGFFVNTLALRSELKADQSFQELLDQVRTTTLEAYEHQEIPFEKVVETVVKQRDLSRSPLFQVMFVYQNTPEMPKLELGELDLSMDTSVAASSKFEITLTMHESNEGLEGSLEYCTDLYSESTIERMQSHFVALLKSITTDPKTQIGELEMLSSEEQTQLLETFNQTKKSYPQDQTIVELFEQQVKRSPQATAIIFEDQILSYQELNEKSNQLAHYLKAKGVKPETLVPICLERSVEMMIGILGILKSGGAYVPIDPQYPQDRMAYMLNDCNSAFLLTTEKHTIKSQNVIQQINLKTTWKQIESYPNSNLKSEAKLKNLAYVIYTSGSTGKPKGVMNQHSGLLNRLLWAQDYYKLSVEDKVLQKTTFCFDVSVWELLWPLISGSQLIFAKPEGHKDQQYLKQIIEEQKITMLHFVPSMLEVFLTDINPSECPSLKKVLTSGEALKPSQVKLFKEKLPGTELHNLYGPTEAAIDVTYWSLPEKKKKIKLVPIGKPVSNTQILILNSANKLVPVGCEGEIHIGGIQVARGYLNNETLTKEKFIINPFDKSRRLYKTGDKGRWLSDGNIEYLGRIDDQLKIRGFRIEPGEIESAIAGSKLTKQSVVIARADQSGSKRLIAYVVGNKMYQKQELMNYLRSKLPDYMIPSVIMELTSIPLTANGKVDKRALPEAEQSSDKQFIAPRNKTEKTLAEIWQQLLEIEQVGIDDNFFELGGHSLLAMRVISQVRSELQIELTVRELFQNPNIRNLAEILAKQNGGLLLPSIDIQVRPTHIPLSFSQERLWFIDQLEGTLQYHIPAVLTLKGHLNLEALHFSFEQIVLRHEVLRTVFKQEDGKPFQKINDSVSSIIQVKDITSLDSETEISNLIEDIISKPFDLSEDLMLRVVLLKRSSMHHILIVSMHHIASDGWSESIIVKELTELYTAFSSGKPPQLEPLAIQYADFAIWQRNHIQGELLETKLNYWKTKLQTPVPIDLPLDYSRPPVQSVRGAVSSFKVDSDLSNRLKQLSHEKNTTLFMTLLAVYKVLLHRYSNQETITVGTPIAGRQQLETEKLIGFFVNTLALRSSVKSDQSFEDLLRNVRNTTLEAYENQEIPFEKIVEAVSKSRDLSRSPIFQVMFVFHNNPDVQASALGDLELSQDMELKPSAKFELTLAMSESSQGIQGTIEYCTDLFKEETILRMQQHFVNLLVALTQNPSQNIGSLEMLSAQEESMIIKDFNAFKKPYPSSKTLVELFLKQVSNSPNSIAIEFEDQSLTYQELNERSNQLAHYLRTKGVKKNQIVPICLKRGPQLLVAILAVLKTESAYAPIDMDYPAERISFMLNDCNASVVIKEKDQQLPMMENCLIINIDQEQSQIDLESKKDLKLNSTPDSIAYIIYTSGSSGTPKGVMVKHQNIVSLVKNTNYVNPGNKDILLTTGSPSFDATTFEYWAMLLNGGKLVLCTEHTLLDSVLLQNEIESRKVSIMWFTSSWFNQLVDLQPNLFKSLKTILVGGEKLSEAHINKLLQHFPKIKIINGYGPTENTTFSLTYPINNVILNGSVPIGKPLNNRTAYVLNSNLKTQPIGVPGEIYLGGAGLSAGYLNNQILTDEKFVANPFELNERIYKTGDLGRWLPDGNMEYLGRLDEQVKIRGYRIELGEIESAIQNMKSIVRSTVALKQDSLGNKKLVAYVISESKFDKEQAISQLQLVLPEYMVPQFWVELQDFPLTPNGKIDKKALPDPDLSAQLSEKYLAPQTKTELDLAEIWQELLDIETIGILDDFFELGGHSLLVIRLLSLIRRDMDVELGVKDIFENPTIQQLAAYVQSSNKGLKMPAITPQKRTEFIPLSFSQERLYFIDQLNGSVQYHISSVLRFNGQLNINALNASFNQILHRHEVLRTVIKQHNGLVFQEVNSLNEWQINRKDVSNLSAKELDKLISKLVNKPFNLAKDLMLRVHLLRTSQDSYLLVLTLHHIASDGWSASIFVKELIEFYVSSVQNKVPNLKPLAIQYADYAIWQRNYLQGNLLEQKLEYWKSKLQNNTPLQLPVDFPRPALQSTRGALFEYKIDHELKDKLKLICQNNNSTMFMTLLAAFKILLFRYSNQQDITVGTPIAGREQMEIEPLIGFFVNTLAIRSEIKPGKSFVQILAQVRNNLLEAYEHQEISFEKVVEAVVKQRDLSRSPLFQVMFIYHNNPEIPALELANLQLSTEPSENSSSKFEITVNASETKDGLMFSTEYCTDLFTEATIKRLHLHFEELLLSIVESPAQRIEILNILPNQEKALIQENYSTNSQTFLVDRTVIGLFEQQVENTPEAKALIFEGQALSYHQLNEKANQVAHCLIQLGVNNQSLVPICIERSFEMSIGILAILKTGAAYVPVDPQYPLDRIQFIIDDCNADILIAGNSDLLIPKPGIRNIDLSDWKPFQNQSKSNLEASIELNNLAYVIYTSGSTGKPKGVMNEHGGLLNRLLWAQSYYKLTEKDCVLQKTTFCFDVSVWELIWPLLVGAKLVFAKPEGHKDSNYLKKIIEDQSITMLHFVPSMLEVFLSDLKAGDCLNLKKVLTSGEALKTHQVQLFESKLPNAQLHNLYGPTEAAIDVTYWSLPKKHKIQNTVPIGKPVANTSIYILDPWLQVVPLGCEGEIHIAGVQVARGYLNNDRLTRQKFVKDPFQTNARMYKTGDKGRWLTDGNIEYLGRTDEQLKVRGFRIEPGEIEIVILESGLVKRTAVIGKQDSMANIQLVAYVVVAETYQKESLLTFLKQKLPDYMIPAVFMEIDEIPLTSNGKLNRKALPEPSIQLTNEIVPPRNELEKTLVEVWKQVLNLETISIHDNFFEIGGHSLLAFRILSGVRKSTGFELELTDLVASPTIAQLAEILQKNNNPND